MGKLTGIRRNPAGNRGKKAQYFDEVVRLYHEEGLNGVEISRILPVHNSNIYRWLDEYDMQKNRIESSMKKQEHQSETGKPRRVIGISVPETSAASGSAIQTGCPSEKAAANELERLKDKVRDLEKQLRDNEKALRESRLKADLYNEIINVAEKKYNVPIRKKAGTRQ